MILLIAVQVISYIQLQGPIKWPILRKYDFALAFLGVPIGYMLINFTRLVNDHFGATWQGRLIGQGVGVTIFAIMSYLLFKEPITVKTGICIALSMIIILINIYWK